MTDPTSHTGVPLPLETAFDRMRLAPTTVDPGDALGRVQVVPRMIQGFRPVTECLEWELSELHWHRAGLSPFVQNDVPFLINNTGRLSEHVAALMFANCVERDDDGPVWILELGAGTGLFAKAFLDAFRAICEQEGRSFYDRLVYFVSDRSPRTIAQWRERNQFAEHLADGCERVALGVVDALDPRSFRPLEGEPRLLSGLSAVFCNYLLDVLPATVLRTGADGIEELRIRTHVTDDDALLRQYTKLDVDELARLAGSADPADRAQLIPLISLLEFETAFVRVTEPPSYASEALAHGAGLERVVLNHGAITCLHECLQLLDPSGFVLLNDYGSVQKEQIAGYAVTQRFGPTSALGINFPFLEHHFSTRGNLVVTPDEDDRRSIHARMILRRELPQSIAAFLNRFGSSGNDFFELPLDEARKHATAGRKTDALESYRVALSRNTRDWQVAGEIAEFVGLQLKDYGAARELAMAALERNPWYSPWLWNVLGDVLFLDGRVDDAHEAYLQALRIHPEDPRTNLNLAYTYLEFGQHWEALKALAAALAADTRGVFRSRLLEKQHQILGAVAGRWLGEQERLSRRAERML